MITLTRLALVRRLRNTSYLKCDVLLPIFIAMATGIVSAYGFPMVIGERSLFSEDPDVHFKYIEAAAKTGQIKEFERVNPGIAPLVVGQLLADVCPEGFIKDMWWREWIQSCGRKFLVPRMNSEDSLLIKGFQPPYLRARALSKVSAAVKGFMTVDHPPELVELLEKIVLQNSAFSGSFNLQNLLILTVIKADPSKAMDYINQLDNFDGSAVGDMPVEAALNEEAFAIFKKFNLNVQAVNVLLDNLRSIERAVEFAFWVEEYAVWSQFLWPNSEKA
ncbi:hypothetical protein H6P81_002353 [Aristolochia fimbriata]|uniref:Uncharacterized protein n=1 Tax=Aristolochia fimbriata TaxID=158543 RepID=A0AAV7F9I8_ARIFI|nr:hypothetical protein H6P81_002353 [Aristolochia fimbriata]